MKQLMLKTLPNRFKKGESLQTLSTEEIYRILDEEIKEIEHFTTTIKNNSIWICYRCEKTFDYCWCNSSAN